MAAPRPGLALQPSGALRPSSCRQPQRLPLARRQQRAVGVRAAAKKEKFQPSATPAAAAPAAAARGPSSGRLSRLLSWRSSAQAPVAETSRTTSSPADQSPAAAAAAARQQHQQHQQQVQRPAAAGPAPDKGSFSLYSWLTWGSGAPPTAAAPTSGSSSVNSSDAADVGDGMAAEPAVVAEAAAAGERRSWYRRAAGKLSSSFSRSSADDGEAAALQAAQRVRPQHPALQVLRARAASGSRPGARADGARLGLVVEGGGMRGCVSGGALQALADLGLRDCFDAVYGSSAGAINGTYFISGQRDGVEIYHDHIASREFINLKRLWKGEGATPVLNLDFLIGHVMRSVHPLHWDAVVASDLPLKVVASSLDSLDSVLLDGFADADDLAACLQASATVPSIAGGPRLHRGHRLVDAAVFQPVPFRSAIADGCTHLLVLCTRPVHLTRASRVNTALADAMEEGIKRAVLSPDYMRPAWQAEVDYLHKDGLSQDDMLLKALTHPAPHELPFFAGAHVYPLYPGAAANFSPLCTDVPTLKAGVAEGRRNVMALARAALSDVLDASLFDDLEAPPSAGDGSNNVVPARASSGARAASARLWQRYMREDMRHQP